MKIGLLTCRILKNDKFLLMEVELIEPDLYFNHAPNAKKTYLRALEAMLTESEKFYFEKT
jgi:hypothetical protein